MKRIPKSKACLALLHQVEGCSARTVLLTSDELMMQYLSASICAANGLLGIDTNSFKTCSKLALYYLWKVGQKTCESSLLEFFRKYWLLLFTFERMWQASRPRASLKASQSSLCCSSCLHVTCDIILVSLSSSCVALITGSCSIFLPFVRFINSELNFFFSFISLFCDLKHQQSGIPFLGLPRWFSSLQTQVVQRSWRYRACKLRDVASNGRSPGLGVSKDWGCSLR